MPEQSKRIIVEGVDVSQLVQFPRLLRAVTASLQPGRLIIGLLMVTALATFGQVWDSLAGPSVVPQGLTEGRWRADVEGVAHQQALRDALRQFTSGSSSAVGAEGDLDAATVLQQMNQEYESRRADMRASEVQAFKEGYALAVERIHQTRPRGVFEATAAHLSTSLTLVVRSLLEVNLVAATDSLKSMLIRTPVTLWKDHRWFMIVYGLFMVMVFAIGGGALARMAAHLVATHQRLGIREAMDFSLQHWPSLIAAQLLPWVILLILCGVIVVMGVLMAAPVLDVLGGVLYGIALVLGLLVAFVLIGYVLGFPMLVPAIGCENCSGPDAMQRAYAYVVTRPLHALGYWLTSLFGLAVGFLLVSIVAAVTLNATATLYSALANNPAMSMAGGYDLFHLTRDLPVEVVAASDWHVRLAGKVIVFWETVVICLVAAYVLVYYFSASTIGYLLMRRVCDGQEPEEIWQPGLVPGTQAPLPTGSGPPASQPGDLPAAD